ncbi:hypothetical protein EDD63_1692 [Breznakia blatticola]|uniref:Uncharacterized protein n=1 Tax=Breznakia blatticola TaxID=1754012 RepID=A0A4R7Z8C3_9FIRM|nr:hypothetical protein [Breznakia blatticola]TDW08586.1 hypothetical protein EDD63_1692 [Breznakia blatticola]
MSKVKKVLQLVCIAITCLSLGVYAGMNINNKSEEISETKLAVVNMDEGVTYNNEERNFGLELIDKSNASITVTGLSDAESGVKEGKYAAYIVLPSNFSENVASINTVQTPTTFEYVISDTLTREAKEQTVYNVLEFGNNYSQNLSNMYIASILNTYHKGQDGALVAIETSEQDLKLINSISSADLTSMVEVKEINVVENQVADLNIDEEKTKSVETMNAVDAKYKEFMLLSKAQLDVIKDTSSQLYTEVESLKAKVANVSDIAPNEFGEYTFDNMDTYIQQLNSSITNSSDGVKSLLQTANDRIDKVVNSNTGIAYGIETKIQDVEQKLLALKTNNTDNIQKINDFIQILDSYNQNILVQKQTLSENNQVLQLYVSVMELSMNPSLNSANQNLADFVSELDGSLAVDQEVTDLKTQIDTYTKQENSTTTFVDFYQTHINGNSTSTLLTENETILNALDTQAIALDEVLTKLTADQTNLSDVESDMQALKTYNDQLKTIDKVDQGNQTTPQVDTNQLKDEVTKDMSNKKALYNSLSQEVLTQNGRVALVRDAFNQANTTFQLLHGNVQLYDPIAYINENDITDFVKQYMNVQDKIESKVQSHEREQDSYVKDVYTTSNTHVQTLRQDLLKANETSNKQVEQGLANVKAVKHASVATTTTSLTDFTNTLGYTRNGSILNQDAVTFIARPVSVNGTISTKTVEQSQLPGMVLLGLAGVGIVGCALLSMKRKKKIAKEEVV